MGDAEGPPLLSDVTGVAASAVTRDILSLSPGTAHLCTVAHLPPWKPDPISGASVKQGLSVAVARLLFAQMYAHAQECFLRTFWPISN